MGMNLRRKLFVSCCISAAVLLLVLVRCSFNTPSSSDEERLQQYSKDMKNAIEKLNPGKMCDVTISHSGAETIVNVTFFDRESPYRLPPLEKIHIPGKYHFIFSGAIENFPEIPEENIDGLSILTNIRYTGVLDKFSVKNLSQLGLPPMSSDLFESIATGINIKFLSIAIVGSERFELDNLAKFPNLREFSIFAPSDELILFGNLPETVKLTTIGLGGNIKDYELLLENCDLDMLFFFGNSTVDFASLVNAKSIKCVSLLHVQCKNWDSIAKISGLRKIILRGEYPQEFYDSIPERIKIIKEN